MPAWTSSASSDTVPRRPGAPPRALPQIKAGLFVLSLAPLARLILAGGLGWFDGLGANPVEFVTRSTGTWTLVFLCLSLVITPLRRLTGANWLVRLRRMLGLYAFFYAMLHFTTYLWFDQFFDLQAIVMDVVKRPFITMGFLAFVLMIPLAVTSTDGMLRRLGRRWSQLHRLVYIVAVAAILHYWWHKSGKNDYSEVAWYAAAVVLMLGWRVVDRYRARVPARRP